MNSNSNNQTLNSAIESIMDHEPPTGAVDKAQARLLDRLAAESTTAAPSRPIWGLATAAALAILILPMVLLLPGPGNGVAFAQVQSYFSGFSTLRAELTTLMNDEVIVDMVARVDESDRARVEVTGQFTIIVDPLLGQMLQLEQQGSRARLMEWDAQSADSGEGALDWLEDIREFQGEAQRIVAVEQIRGQEAIGFELLISGQAMTLWATEEGRPLQLIIQSGTERSAGDQPFQVVTQVDFHFDEPMDADLFSLTPPTGYILED
ncbi:MAG: hypothetical protein AAGJ52_07635 [Pseudomonadota bacterium]